MILCCVMATPERISQGLCKQFVPEKRIDKGAVTCSQSCKSELDRKREIRQARKLAGTTCPTCHRYVCRDEESRLTAAVRKLEVVGHGNALRFV